MVDGQGHGVEHVLPEAFLPAPVLGEVDAKRWEARGDHGRDLALGRLAVPENGLPDLLRSVGGEPEMPSPSEPACVEGQAVEVVQPRDWMAVGLLDDDHSRPVGPCPAPELPLHFKEASLSWMPPIGDCAARQEPWASDDSPAEFSEARIDGKDGGFMLHGRVV